MHSLAELLDRRAEPRQFLRRDHIMLRVACLDVGVLQLFEHRPLAVRVAWPDVDQAAIESLSLGAQEAPIVYVRGVEGADQQDATVEALDYLM